MATDQEDEARRSYLAHVDQADQESGRGAAGSKLRRERRMPIARYGNNGSGNDRAPPYRPTTTSVQPVHKLMREAPHLAA